MSAGLHVVRSRRGAFWVTDAAGERVSQAYGDRVRAEAALARLQHAAQQQDRTCITCRRSFRSDGPHNRMCQRCRASVADDPLAPYRVLTEGRG